MSKKNEPKILIDSDVFRHFLNGNRIITLTSIYPDRFVMLSKVKDELCLSRSLVQPVTNFLTMFNVPVMDFPNERQIIQEYAALLRKYGPGESACMAVARFQKQFIASSNLKDIKTYCETNGITYLTTMDILAEAMNKKIMTEAECDQFINDVKTKGSRLPCNTMKEYAKMK